MNWKCKFHESKAHDAYLEHSANIFVLVSIKQVLELREEKFEMIDLVAGDQQPLERGLVEVL